MATDVEKLLGSVKPLLMVTDPPYGVDYDPAWRNRTGVAATKRTATVLNDDRADWREAWAMFPGDVAYVWHGALHGAIVADSLEMAGFTIRAQIIWAKERLVLSRGDYHWQHEPCQPPGTMVSVPGGSAVPIESLCDGDRVVSVITLVISTVLRLGITRPARRMAISLRSDFPRMQLVSTSFT